MTSQDEQYLRILSIMHFVVAGLTALFACFPVFHLAMGLTFLFGGFPTPPDEAFPVRLFGAMFVIIPLVLILSGWALAVSMAVSGYFLSKKQRHTYCLVVAGIECIFIPFGTILGIFTIVLLTKPEIREAFAS